MSNKIFALLVVAVVGITSSCDSKAIAETRIVTLGDAQVSSEDDSYLADEARWRERELPEQDFKRVFGPVDKPMEFELDVPRSRWSDGTTNDSPSERMISLWFATARGGFAIDLLDTDRQPVVSWQGGRRGDQSLVRNLVPGKYVVKLRPIDGARIYGVVGVKALYSGRCELEQLTEYPADPVHGYWWPYLLFTPALPTADVPRPPGAGTLLVLPNNTANPTDDLQLIRAIAKCALLNDQDINGLEIAKTLGTPILVPLFPRPELKELASNLHLQGLTRPSLEEDLQPRFARVDRQLIAMIDAARDELAKRTSQSKGAC